MKTILAISALGIMTASACASTTPPSELVNARAAYERARTGQTAQLDPTDLHVAKVALDEAERAFSEDATAQKTRDAAYTAQRKVEIAEARARTIAARQETERMIADAETRREQALARTRAELGRKQTELEDQREALATERERRVEAERRAKQTAADLAQVAKSVKVEPRGTVITLSGAVLFQTAKSTLLPTAQAKLSEVARALRDEDKDSTFLIEGHTDSQGSDDFNMTLSQQRAESVKSYLVSHGIAEDRITATGKGESQPIASNDSTEGRANNRRVEIIVQHPSSSSSTSSR